MRRSHVRHVPAELHPTPCCAGVQPAADGGSDDGPVYAEDCPGSTYPNNWTCDSQTGACVHGGCDTDADCGHPLLKCRNPLEVSGPEKFCLQECNVEDTDPCYWVASGMKCTGLTSAQTEYCRQDPFPE